MEEKAKSLEREMRREEQKKKRLSLEKAMLEKKKATLSTSAICGEGNSYFRTGDWRRSILIDMTFQFLTGIPLFSISSV